MNWRRWQEQLNRDSRLLLVGILLMAWSASRAAIGRAAIDGYLFNDSHFTSRTTFRRARISVIF
jgi:hypothetical protein